jgi:hypothetical protein
MKKQTLNKLTEYVKENISQGRYVARSHSQVSVSFKTYDSLDDFKNKLIVHSLLKTKYTIWIECQLIVKNPAGTPISDLGVREQVFFDVHELITEFFKTNHTNYRIMFTFERVCGWIDPNLPDPGDLESLGMIL